MPVAAQDSEEERWGSWTGRRNKHEQRSTPNEVSRAMPRVPVPEPAVGPRHVTAEVANIDPVDAAEAAMMPGMASDGMAQATAHDHSVQSVAVPPRASAKAALLVPPPAAQAVMIRGTASGGIPKSRARVRAPVPARVPPQVTANAAATVPFATPMAAVMPRRVSEESLDKWLTRPWLTRHMCFAKLIMRC